MMTKITKGIVGVIVEVVEGRPLDVRRIVCWVEAEGGFYSIIITPPPSLPPTRPSGVRVGYDYVVERFAKCGSLLTPQTPQPKGIHEALGIVKNVLTTLDKEGATTGKVGASPYGIVFDEQLRQDAKGMEKFPIQKYFKAGGDQHG